MTDLSGVYGFAYDNMGRLIGTTVWRTMRCGVYSSAVQGREQWPWSSYRSYAFDEPGAARINQWGEAKMKVRTRAA